MRLIQVNSDENGSRLDHFLKRSLINVPFSLLAKLARKGLIKVNGRRTLLSYHVQVQDQITLPEGIKDQPVSHEKNPSQSLLKKLGEWIVFEDDDLLVLNKPSGIATQGGSRQKNSLDVLLNAYFAKKNIQPRLVHRLDKHTSGILLVGKTLFMTKYLADCFKKNALQKTYICLALGQMKKNKGVIETPLEEKDGKMCDAHTIFEVIASKKGITFLKLSPKTGRTHQLRRHLLSTGHPILGDDKYALKELNSKDFCAHKDIPNMLYLHAQAIEFTHPSGRLYKFHADLPSYFMSAIKKLGWIDILNHNGSF